MPLYLWHTRLCLAALGLMLSLPFLNPHHFNPIPTFYQEWTAAACALLAATLLLRAKIFEQLEIPGIALLPLGIATLILIQFAAGRVTFPTQALIFLLYLLWATLLLILGRALRRALALDLLEEFRAPLADRLTLTLINRGQIRAADFDESHKKAAESVQAVL